MGTERLTWKSERFVIVMTGGTAQPAESEGTALLQSLDERRRPAQSSKEVEHVR